MMSWVQEEAWSVQKVIFFFPSPPFAAIAADMLRCRIHFGVTMKLLIGVVHTTKGFQMSKGKKERKKCQ